MLYLVIINIITDIPKVAIATSTLVLSVK